MLAAPNVAVLRRKSWVLETCCDPADSICGNEQTINDPIDRKTYRNTTCNFDLYTHDHYLPIVWQSFWVYGLEKFIPPKTYLGAGIVAKSFKKSSMGDQSWEWIPTALRWCWIRNQRPQKPMKRHLRAILNFVWNLMPFFRSNLAAILFFLLKDLCYVSFHLGNGLSNHENI